MCGFAGILSKTPLDPEKAKNRLESMAGRIAHRGPDDSGFWQDFEAGIGFGFRRLAIQDVSPLGAQPMASTSGRYVLVLNGEIYNFVELREELAGGGARFRGGSDTEVVLAAVERWGVEESLKRFVGMFAIALWDRELRRLSLARDRLGIKPLYYGVFNREILFGSELKAMRFDPAFQASVSPTALAAYLRYLYVPAPETIFQGVRKLLPGHLLHIENPWRDIGPSEPYWSLGEAARAGLSDPYSGTEEEAANFLEQLLSDAIRIRLRSDVPIGVLLSGGIDSSTVAALAQTALHRPLRTFSIGFDSPEHDESRHARAVAEHIGTDHTELRVEGKQVVEAVPRVMAVFDEPLADPSHVPTFLVSDLARREVTVALAGDGGDELFGGYNRYSAGETLIPWLCQVPKPIRTVMERFVHWTGPNLWDSLSGLAGERFRVRLAGEKAVKLGEMLAADSQREMYRSLVSAGIKDSDSILGRRCDAPDILAQGFSLGPPSGLLDRMMLSDQLTYLPDDLLAKVDRASMTVALEVRVPILDHRVVEFSWRLPDSYKVRNGSGKYLLKRVLYRHVPKSLVERPKTGFSPPVAEWLQGPLREWAGDLLNSRKIKEQGLFDAGEVNSRLEAFFAGRRETALGIWAMVQFQAWSETYL